MPLLWKLANFLFVCLPRVLLWKNLSFAGVYFLMETASMVDQIVNTTALSFIFQLDELILERLTTKTTKYMIEQLHDYPLFDEDVHEECPDEEVIERYIGQEMHWRLSYKDWWLLPRRLLWSVGLTCIFLAQYYASNCVGAEDG